jgi:hypothetical protein
MAMTYVEEAEDYLIEGTYLLPEYVAELHQTLEDRIRACFVGFAEIDTWEMSDGLSIDHYTKEYEKKTERENIYAKLGPGKNSSHRED